ncbi:MAG: porin family protein [Nitrospirae bacterium]|nr:MAG: porin family protein [Nitrospirota bacterium]
MSLLLAWSMTVTSFLTTEAQADWYVGAYGGLASPGEFSNATLSSAMLGGGVTDARISDLELKNGPVWGAKLGNFFKTRPWVALEADVYTLTQDVKQQVIVGGTTSGSVFAATLPGSPLRLTPVTMNIIVRSPNISELFQPYGGIGYGLIFVASSQGGASNLHISSGLNLLAGARIRLAPKWSLFGEFKFNRATIRFNDLRGNYDAQLFVGGLMWHFM